ncbi:MAG: hypothetical protein J5964_03190 [Eubacterium sp.]|nr:hypothetical protein [Eubacterium sp.]
MRIKLKGARKIKTLTGFGGSACWWSTALADEKKREDIAELLYGDSGLGLNIYRYNVGGGFEKGNVRVDNPWRVIESFMNEDGSFDYSRDENAVKTMDACLKKGNVDTLIFFVNSPHFSHLVTRQTSGGFEEHFSNLRKDCYGKFASYLIDIAEHFISEGYPVKYISPINEPQWKWGGDYVWQEGCHYEPEEVRDCFKAFANELEKRKSPLLLYGPESGSIDDNRTKEYYKLLESEPLIMKYLDTFAYHSYHSDNRVSDKVDFGKWAKRNIKTPHLDMSEWCELPCKHNTEDIVGTLIIARIIGEDLIYSGAESWTAWVCINQMGTYRDGGIYSDGLLHATDDFSEYHIAKRYYAMAHYSKYIPAGSVSLDLGYMSARGFSLFAFKRPDGAYALIAVNNSRAKRCAEPDIKFTQAQVITSTQDSQLKEYITEKTDKISIEPMSVSTIILR